MRGATRAGDDHGMRRGAGLLVVLLPFWAAGAEGEPPGRATPLPIDDVPRAGGSPQTTFTGKPFPPPGSPADQALLKDLLLAQSNMLSQRAWAVKATQRLGGSDYERRLRALELRAGQEGRADLERLRTRLRDAWDEVSRLMNARWLVDGRLGCRQSAIDFEVHMAPGPAAATPRLRSAAAERARRCLDRQKACVDPLEKANRVLASAVRDADLALGKASAPREGDSDDLTPDGDHVRE